MFRTLSVAPSSLHIFRVRTEVFWPRPDCICVTREVIRCQHGEVPLEALLNTHLFDMEQAEASAGWKAELAKPAHTPETEECGQPMQTNTIERR